MVTTELGKAIAIQFDGFIRSLNSKIKSKLKLQHIWIDYDYEFDSII